MTERDDAERHWDDWARALGDDGLVSYRHIACSSRATSPHTAEGGFRVRPDLRARSGALAIAPLGIAMLDTAGINVDALAVVAPTQIDVTVLDPARDVEALAITGRVVRAGRTQMVTEARFADRASRARVVAYGTATWAVVAPCPPGYRYVDPTAATVPGGTAPPIVDAFDATPRSGGGFELAGLSARVGASSLHQGPIQVMLEAAAYERACEAAGSQALDPLHANVSIVQRGIRGPFVASAEVVARSRGSVACRAELRDDGADGRVVAFGLARYSSEESTE